MACSEWNDIRDEIGYNVGAYDNPADLTAKSWTVMCFSEVEENGKLEWLIRKDGCMHCADPGCLQACPAEGAIIQYANGIVDFQSEHCIGCGYCIAGCPFNVPWINKEDNRVYKCTLCVDRVGELKGCGYENAGLYDPEGAGGTHVMYVLRHANKPQLYHGLPDNPSISPTVTFWKGIWKPLAAVGFAATFTG